MGHKSPAAPSAHIRNLFQTSGVCTEFDREGVRCRDPIPAHISGICSSVSGLHALMSEIYFAISRVGLRGFMAGADSSLPTAELPNRPCLQPLPRNMEQLGHMRSRLEIGYSWMFEKTARLKQPAIRSGGQMADPAVMVTWHTGRD